MKKYIMALDEGTTSCRSLIIDNKGRIVASDQINISTYNPKEGWVEQDALEIWSLQKTAMIQSLNKTGIPPKYIESIGITNQRETVVIWDKSTGLPVYNAIVWKDTRTREACIKLEKKYGKLIKEKTGLIMSPYFCASKIRWILDNIPNGQARAEAGELYFGTINTWLIYKLTDSRVFATDVTNASRTMLFNIRTQEWDDELLEIFNIPRILLPVVKENADHFGRTGPGMFIKTDPTRVPITASMGDQQAALFGHLCIEKGETKITYGTGCFILTNTGKQLVESKSGLVTTIGFKFKNQTHYALEGSIMVGGSAIAWLKDDLRLIYSVEETEFYAKNSNIQESLYVVPAFAGLGAPHWDSTARGLIIGIDFSTKREQLIVAFLKSIVYQVHDVLEAMANDLGEQIYSIKVDGGVIKNKYIMQFQADISQAQIIRPINVEASAFGVAFMAGLYTGFWSSLDEIQATMFDFTTKGPTISQQKADDLLKGWRAAVKRSRGWTEEVVKKEEED